MPLARAVLLGGPVAGLVLLAAPAGAHVSITPDTVEAGEEAVVTLALDHGCGDSATTRLEVRLPDQLAEVAPGPTRDWRVEQRGRVLVLDAVSPRPSDLTTELAVAFRAPDEAGTLTFPTVQTCEEGEEAWTQVATGDGSAAGLEHPAPVVRVVADRAAAQAGGAAGDGEDGAAWLAPALVATGGLATLLVAAAWLRTRSTGRGRAG